MFNFVFIYFPLSCEVCKVSFTRNSNLKTHYRSRQHQNKLIAMSAKSEIDSKNK